MPTVAEHSGESQTTGKMCERLIIQCNNNNNNNNIEYNQSLGLKTCSCKAQGVLGLFTFA
jgi:hypothetical protein